MKSTPAHDPVKLRRAAEARLKARPAAAQPKNEADLRQLQHELEVHQIELEMQNEQLVETQAQLAAALERYSDHFDFAPVGYFNLTADGRIQLVNLTGARLVGVERAQLPGRSFRSLLAPRDRGAFDDFLARVFATNTRDTHEVTMISKGGPTLSLLLEGTVTPDRQECRLVSIDITERKQSERVRRESDEQFRIMVESVTDYAIFMLDPSGHVLSWNAGAQRIKGYAESEILGQHLSRFYLPEDIKRGKPARDLALAAAEGRFRDEGWQVRKDGSRFMANVVVMAQHDKAGRLRGFVKATRDITERKAAEDALLAANNTLQSIFDAAPVAVLSFDLQGRVTHWSAGAERLFGWTAAEALGRICVTVPEENMADFLAMVDRVAGGGVENLVRVRQKKNGQRIEARLSPAPLRDRSGTTTGIMVILEDITEKRRAEEAVRQSEMRLASLIDIAADAIVSVDANQRIQIFNKGAEEIFGYRAAEVIGQPLDLLLPARFAGAHQAHVQGFASAPEPARLMGTRREVFGRRKGGGEFPAEASISKQDIGGQITFTVILRDVTARKQAETALRQSERELRLFAHATNDAFWNWDLATGHIDRSIGFQKNFGYPLNSTEPVIEWWLERTHPQDRDRVAGTFFAAFAAGKESWSYIYRFKRQDDSWATVEDRVCVVRDDAGTAVRAIGAMTDITERIEQQAAILRASQQLAMAEENERRRIAKELHDSTAQDLVAVILNLETLRETSVGTNPTMTKPIEDSIALLENSAHEIRTLSYLLHPPRLDEAGLAGAIRDYLAGFGERTGILTRVELPTESFRVDSGVEMALFRVVQESLGNIYRHAKSPTATVRLVRQEGSICLEIQDEGVGIPRPILCPSNSGNSRVGVGLPSMHERLRQVGGRLEIESNPHGTLVRAVVPDANMAG